MNKQGFDVYIGMNVLRPGARGRRKEDVSEVRHLYLDLDHEGDKALERLRASAKVPKPGLTVSTSPGKYQIIWRVQGFSVDQAEQTLRGLVIEFGGDPAATDVSRVLRLPGFLNHKYTPPAPVEIVRAQIGMSGPADFSSVPIVPALGVVKTPKPVRHTRSRGATTQSEREWAYALRALKRGDLPEFIVGRIGEFAMSGRNRQRRKDDPERYARYTVVKAQTSIFQNSTESEHGRQKPALAASPPAKGPTPRPMKEDNDAKGYNEIFTDGGRGQAVDKLLRDSANPCDIVTRLVWRIGTTTPMRVSEILRLTLEEASDLIRDPSRSRHLLRERHKPIRYLQ
jgi:hypothetical protein